MSVTVLVVGVLIGFGCAMVAFGYLLLKMDSMLMEDEDDE